MEAIELLLEVDSEKFKPQIAEVKIKRLSEMVGKDVIFEIQALTFNQISELKRMHEDDEFKVMVIVRALKTKLDGLFDKFKAENTKELLEVLLTGGEIEDLYFQVSKISGYMQTTIEEIKKKSTLTEHGN